MESQSRLTIDELVAIKKSVHEVLEELHTEQSKLTTVGLEALKKYVHEALDEVDKFKKTNSGTPQSQKLVNIWKSKLPAKTSSAVNSLLGISL
jgi:hypothetical protein